MAIKNLQTIKRIQKLAYATVTEVSAYKFNSIEEIKEFLKDVAPQVKDYALSIKNMDKLFAETSSAKPKVSSKIRVNPLEMSALPEVEIKDVDRYKGTPKPNKKSGVAVQKIEFHLPNTKQLKASFKIVDDMQEKIETLDSVINTVGLNFAGDRSASAIVKEAKTLRSELDKQVKKALAILNDIATKHEPEKFSNMISKIIGEILVEFKRYYKAAKQVVYVTPIMRDEKEYILFTHFVEFNDFANDQGYNQDLFLVFSCLLDQDKGEGSFYCTALDKFATPGKFSLGHAFKDTADGRARAHIELQNHNISYLIEDVALPTTQEDLRKVNWRVPKDKIKSLQVKDNVIDYTFTSDVTAKERDEFAKQLMVDLKTFFANKIKANVTVSTFKNGRLYGASFKLVLAHPRKERKEIVLDESFRKALTNKYQLSPKQSAELVKAINKMAFDATEEFGINPDKSVEEKTPYLNDDTAKDKIADNSTAALYKTYTDLKGKLEKTKLTYGPRSKEYKNLLVQVDLAFHAYTAAKSHK